MNRNLFHRNESCFEIKQKFLKERIRHDLELFLADNCQSWALQSDGSYERITFGDDKPVSAQEVFLSQLTTSP
jgi:polyphosphate kinase